MGNGEWVTGNGEWERGMGNGEWERGMGNGNGEWGTGNGKSKIVEIVVNAESIFFSGCYHIFGNVLRQNKRNLSMISSKRER